MSPESLSENPRRPVKNAGNCNALTYPRSGFRTGSKAVSGLSRNATLLLGATLGRIVFSFGFFVLFAAPKLGLQGCGQYGLVNHYFELFLSLSATAVGIYLTREVAKHPAQLSELATHAGILASGLALVGGVIIVLIFRWANYSTAACEAMWIATAALLPAALGLVLESALIALERSSYVMVGTLIESVIRFGGGALILSIDGRLNSVFAMLAVARCLQAGYYLVCLRRVSQLTWRLNTANLGTMFLRWRVFAGENWLATLYSSLDVIVLSIFRGEIAVGLYTASWRIVRLGSVAAKSYTTAVYPVLSRLHVSSRDLFELLNQTTLRLMIAVTVPTALAVTLLAPQVVRLLYDAEFDAAAPVLRILVWGLVVECLNPFLSHTLFAQDAQHKSLKVALITFVVNLGAVLFFAKQWGAAGTAVATIGAAAVATCCYCIIGLRPEHRQQLLWDALRVGVASLAISLASWQFGGTDRLGGVLAGCVLYLGLLVALRVITMADLQMLRRAF